MTLTNVEKKQELLKFLKVEYFKIKEDYIYFVNKYVRIQHPTKGIIPFKLYDFQKNVLNVFFQENRVIILKARQLGLSTLVAAYIAHKMIFTDHFSAIVIATKQQSSLNLVKKVKLIFKQLPPWFQYFVKLNSDNALSVELTNGSYFLAETSSGSDAARSFAASLLILDEAAFIPRATEVWTGALPILSTGGQAILISTPNGVGNLFYNIWQKAEAGENDFAAIKLPWYVHPDRDQAWRDKQTAEAKSPSHAEQENDCTFLFSGKSVISGKTILTYEEKTKEPISKSGKENGLWIWEKPVVGYDYVISADVATAGGDDYCAAHVIEVNSLTQVAEYKGHLNPEEFGNELLGLAQYYNNGILAIENNSIGWAAVVPALQAGYENLYWSERGSVEWVDPHTVNEIMDSKKIKAGWTTSSKSRPIIINNLEKMINSGEVNINSIRLINELKTFIWKNGKAIAVDGSHDDLVLSFAIGLWVRTTAYETMQKRKEYDMKKTEWITQRIGNKTTGASFFTNNRDDDPYIFEYGKLGKEETEDLRHWL